MNSKKYNLLFLGSSPLAKQCLKYILQSSILTLKCIVSKDESFIYEKRNKINWVSSHDRNEIEILEIISKENINLIISVQHPWIISKKIIDKVNGFAFNLHNAKIPEYKGHNTFSHAILNEEKTYSTTIHWIVPEVDMGEIAFELTIDIEINETAFSLHNKLTKKAVIIFRKLIDSLESGNNIPKVMIEGNGTFYSKFGLEKLKRIKNMNEVSKKARAFYFPPHSPAYILIDGLKYNVVPEPINKLEIIDIKKHIDS